MGIADLFRPKYRHSDVRVRTEAVKALTSDDVAILTQVARTDRDIGVRRLAIEKLDDAEVVADIAGAETERSLRELASERAAELWAGAACGDDKDDAATALAGIIKLGGQRALVDIVVRAAQPAVRKRAFGELRDPRALAELAKSEASQDLRVGAVGRIDDGDVLRALAIDTTTKEVGLAAVDKIDDADRLENVAQKAKNKAVRQRARKILTEMEEAEQKAKPGVPDEVKRRRAEKAQLVREVEAVVDSFDFAKAEVVIKRAEEAFGKLAADDGDDRFTKTVQRFWRRKEIHSEQARSSDELRAIEREAQAEKERAAEAKKAEAAAAAAQPIEQPDDPARLAREAEARARREEREARNKEMQDRRAAEQADRETRRKEDAERGAAIATSLLAMVEDLEKLVGTKDGRVIDRALQQAGRAFEQIGKVPALQRDAIGDRYTAARGKLVVAINEMREAEDWARWANVPKAEALIATAKEFLEAPVTPDLGNRLRGLQALWKEVGPMPQKRSKDLWDQFKAACDQVYDKVRGQRAVLDEQFAEVVKVKEALIAEAEALADSDAWGETATKLKELQAKWKESGHLPRRQGDDLWKRFRAACDKFFERRKPMIEAARAEEDGNLAKKNALIQRAREIAAKAPGEGGWGKSIGQIKDVQAEWKSIGYVPRREADRVYREFRAACDALFAKRDEARDGEANAHRAELDAVKAEIEAVRAGGDDVVARAIAVRAKAQELSVFADEIEAMVRHVVTSHAVAGTELDPAAARGRRDKLIARAEELVPKEAPAAAPSGDVAAQLKKAMSANAFGSLRWSGRDPAEVIEELRAAWREAGPVFDDADKAQQATFDDVCDRVLASVGREPKRQRRERRDERDAVPAVATSGDTTRGAAPAPEVPAVAAVAVAAPVAVVPTTDVTAPLGLAGKLDESHGAPVSSGEIALPRTRTSSTPPPISAKEEEVDGGWDLGDEDPTAPSSPPSHSPPSASEMAGDGATGGDGVTDDPGWD